MGAPKAALLAVSGSLRGAVPLGAVSGFLLGAACGSLLAMPPVLLGSWYTARYGFGVESTAFDIGLYGLVVALGFLLLCRLQKRPWTERQVGICIMLAGLWGGALLIGSAAPLELPLFEP
ncbi:MAG: hypothetical protein ACLSHU_10645 [Oscillospiraceae bacterium]